MNVQSPAHQGANRRVYALAEPHKRMLPNRPTLALKRPSGAADPAPVAAEPTADTAPGPKLLTWECRPALAARIRALGVAPRGFIAGVVRSAVRNRERGATGVCEDLHIVNVPAGTGDRLAHAAAATGRESVSEWASAVLLSALDSYESMGGDAA